jgi:hypothetical protein
MGKKKTRNHLYRPKKRKKRKAVSWISYAISIHNITKQKTSENMASVNQTQNRNLATSNKLNPKS